MELIVESMKNKENNYLIESSHAIIKKKLTCILQSLNNLKAAKKMLNTL